MYITSFLVKMQEHLDLKQVSRMILQNLFHKQFISLMLANDFEVDSFEQREKWIKNMEKAKLDTTFYSSEVRAEFIQQMLNQSIDLQLFDVSCEIALTFIRDMHEMTNFVGLEQLINQFVESRGKYESKIHLVDLLLPAFTQAQCEKFLKQLTIVIKDSGEGSIFLHNMSPFRLGLMLYKLVNDIQNKYP